MLADHFENLSDSNDPGWQVCCLCNVATSRSQAPCFGGVEGRSAAPLQHTCISISSVPRYRLMTGRFALLGGQERSWHRDMTGRLTAYRLRFPPSLSSAGKVMRHPLPCVSANFEECVPTMTDMNDPVGGNGQWGVPGLFGFSSQVRQ